MVLIHKLCKGAVAVPTPLAPACINTLLFKLPLIKEIKPGGCKNFIIDAACSKEKPTGIGKTCPHRLQHILRILRLTEAHKLHHHLETFRSFCLQIQLYQSTLNLESYSLREEAGKNRAVALNLRGLLLHTELLSRFHLDQALVSLVLLRSENNQYLLK